MLQLTALIITPQLIILVKQTVALIIAPQLIIPVKQTVQDNPHLKRRNYF